MHVHAVGAVELCDEAAQVGHLVDWPDDGRVPPKVAGRLLADFKAVPSDNDWRGGSITSWIITGSVSWNVKLLFFQLTLVVCGER